MIIWHFSHPSHSHHHDQVARALIEAKADVNKANHKGFVALMHASQNGHELVSMQMFCVHAIHI